MKNTAPNTPTSPTSKISLLSLNFILLLAAFGSLLIAVIGVYHALLFVIAHAWTPLFLYAAPTITLLAAASVVYTRQPVHSLLSLITVFFITTLLYIYAGAEFLAFLFLIVYVGAIAILFLFVIILLQIKDTLTETNVTNTGTVLISLPVAVVVVIGLEDFIIQSFTETFIYNNVQTNTEGVNVVEALTYYVNYKFADILLFSTLLYTEYSFLLFLAALLLLTAIIGAIVLAISAVTIPTIKNPMKTTMNVLTQTIENNKPVTTLKKTNISFFPADL